jgi:hypothetical protein
MRRVIDAARRAARSIGGLFRGKGGINERMDRDQGRYPPGSGGS